MMAIQLTGRTRPFISEPRNPMKLWKETMKTVVAGFALALIATAAAAQNADDEAIRSYTLSMDKVVHYDAAARALEAAMNKDPAVKSDRQKMGREFARTPGRLEARLDRHPRVLAFFTSEGLTKGDAALIPLVLTNGCLAADYPQLAKGLVYSDAQVQFCKNNRVALHKLRIFAPVRPNPPKQ